MNIALGYLFLSCVVVPAVLWAGRKRDAATRTIQQEARYDIAA